MKRNIRFLFYTLAVIFVSLFIIVGCSDDDDDIFDDNLPVVTTIDITEIESTTATSGGNITDDGGATVTARGVIWSTSADLTVNNNDGITVDGAGAGSFTSNITGLEPETQYYVRAYATNSSGTGYGNALALTTLEETTGTVTDIDGNVYLTVTIGNQEWMAENLRVTRYNNGVAIPTGLHDEEWGNTTDGAYAVYPHVWIPGLNSDEKVLEAYGALYNWYAINNPKGLCPTGWSVPSDDDWTQLIDYVVSQSFPNSNYSNGTANALKSCRQVDSPLGGDCDTSEHPRWGSHGTHHGFDEFGFSALPGGFLWYHNGFSLYVGFSGGWWSATESSATDASRWSMICDEGRVSWDPVRKMNGFSLRCVRD